MIEFILASTLLTCEGSYELAEKIRKSSQTPNKEELIEVIKANTEPECYGSEQGDSSST